MNIAPVTALSWEIFGRNRSALLMNAAIAAALGVATRFAGLAGPMSIMILVSFSLLFSSTFSYVDLNPRTARAGFPRHILVLPLATWVLALVPILGGAAFISAFVLLWLRFLTGAHLDVAQQLAIAGAITGLSSWMQAMSWELIRRRMARHAVLILVCGLASLSLGSLLSDDELLLGRAGGAVALLALMLSGYFFAWRAVVSSRRGDAGESGASTGRLRSRWSPFAGPSRTPRLDSGTAAQEWYEWQVHGRLAPLCMVFLGAILLALMVFDGVRSSPSTIEIGFLLFTFVMISPLGGSSFALKNPQVPRAMLAPFFASLPLDDVELAFAKLRMSARSHLLTLGVVFITIAAILVSSDNNARVEGYWSWLSTQLGSPGAFCAALLLALFVAVATWTAGAFLMAGSFFFAADEGKKSTWKYLVAALGGLAVLKYSGWLPLSRQQFEFLLAHAHLIALGLLAASTLLAAFALRAYARSNPVAAVRKVLAGCGALTASSLVLVWQLRLPAHLSWAASSFAVAMTMSALIPILRMPGMIAKNRHR